jgi:hypothetical protein
MEAVTKFAPLELTGLATYPLGDRPSKVFRDDLGQPAAGSLGVAAWLDTLPRQLAGTALRQVRDHLVRCARDGHPVVAALGGHVIKTGCGPYLTDWIQRGFLSGVAMNGSAAIHDLELALAGKTSEDVAAQLPEGKFGMARETADAFAVASRIGAQENVGLGRGLGQYLIEQNCAYAETSVLIAAYRAGIPCTIHVALGTDIVHMHPHVSGAALGESSLIDFRLLCALVATMTEGVWMNLGSAVIMPEVFLKVVSVVRNLGRNLDGLVAISLDKNANYRSRVNVVERPVHEGIELIGCHEIMIPLLHAALAEELAGRLADEDSQREAA